MKSILNRLTTSTLSKEEAKQVIINISKEEYDPAQISAFLTVFMMRRIKVEEIEGFRDALLELCIALDFSDYDFIDLCGTGGDGKDTFNISTLSSFVVAGAGIKVAKHGNYGVSSSCGSSNVLEYLDIKFTNEEDTLRKALETANICILHAPLFHPAMKNVATVRKSLAVKTFFNMLGPMVNPSFPKFQMAGVYNLELLRVYNYIYQKTDKKYSIIYDFGGYDEMSLTDNIKLVTNYKEIILSPQHLKSKYIKKASLISSGGTVEESAKIFMDVLSDEATPEQKQVVIVNAALAISTVNGMLLEDAVELARESIESGRAKTSFDKLKTIV